MYIQINILNKDIYKNNKTKNNAFINTIIKMIILYYQF